MNRWIDDIVIAIKNLGGIAHRSNILSEVKRIRPEPHPESIKQIIQRTIQSHSSDASGFQGKDLFYTVRGIGSGVWGLRSSLLRTPEAADLAEPDDKSAPRVLVATYRILRDTELSRKIKALHQNTCQLCGHQIRLADGSFYAEAHHIQPLGSPHNGPDIADNIIVLCPNHHVMLDYGALEIDVEKLHTPNGHAIGKKFIDYHNNVILKSGI